MSRSYWMLHYNPLRLLLYQHSLISIWFIFFPLISLLKIMFLLTCFQGFLLYINTPFIKRNEPHPGTLIGKMLCLVYIAHCINRSTPLICTVTIAKHRKTVTINTNAIPSPSLLALYVYIAIYRKIHCGLLIS